MGKKFGYYFLLVVLSGLLVYYLLYMPQRLGENIFSRMDKRLVNSSRTDSKMLFLNAWRIIKGKYYDSTLNNQDWTRWKRRYIKEIKTDEDAYIAINSMLASLDDPYSKFMDEDEYVNQNINIDAKLTGIGVNLVSAAGKAVIVGVIDETPAAAAGLKAGDIIVTIDGKDTHGLQIDEIVKLIRGPIGTKVAMVVHRNGNKLTKTLVRGEIRFKNIKSKIVDKNIGYIQINSFMSSEMDSEFISALKGVEGVKALIIDLRGNMGGLLPNAVYVANFFLPKGNIVNIVDRNGIKTPIVAQIKTFEINVPLVVLVDGASASASEILSGALKDYKRAYIVGETTFGKGKIQKIFPLPNKTGMNLTIATYLTPNGHDINKKGIEPDFRVRLTEKDFLSGNDTQLKKAIELLHNM